MRRFLTVLMLLSLAALALAATNSPARRAIHDNVQPGGNAILLIVASDTSLSATGAWKLASREAYTVMPKPDTLRVRSSSTSDTLKITLYYVSVNAAGTDSINMSEVLRISGTDTVYSGAATKGTKALHFEAAVLDSAPVGTISIYSKTGGLLTTITPGLTQTQTAIHFTGPRGGGLISLYVEADTASTVETQLRYYPNMLSIITPTTGYEVKSRAKLQPNSRVHEFTPWKDTGYPLYLPPHGVVAVFDRGSVTKIYNIRMNVYDK